MISISQPVGYNHPVIYPQPMCYQPLPAYTPRASPASGNIMHAVLWFLALLFFAWPLAFTVCSLYVLVSPFGPCCKCVSIITDALLIAVRLPLTCSENMLRKTPFC
ncbi:hypothetical protein Bpfe_003989 [Biomphalaria pfeifferi]|uniref:Uncharacterized protein n=1 Tax=Biomphalaria pfeifferi TaxID=112525 RepID=A0AAD8FIS0_BIOPF|nr:hypothetical protein Bpfe_003989 [Biomphalaria pfeifferi]